MNTLHLTPTQERHRWAYIVRNYWTDKSLETSVMIAAAIGGVDHWKDVAIVNAYSLRNGMRPARDWL